LRKLDASFHFKDQKTTLFEIGAASSKNMDPGVVEVSMRSFLEVSSLWRKFGRPVETFYWLVVSTHLKNISQIGSFPQVEVKKKIFETTS